nr:hypothetical protein [Pseudarthrobacter psychrotolerans]
MLSLILFHHTTFRQPLYGAPPHDSVVEGEPSGLKLGELCERIPETSECSLAVYCPPKQILGAFILHIRDERLHVAVGLIGSYRLY